MVSLPRCLKYTAIFVLIVISCGVYLVVNPCHLLVFPSLSSPAYSYLYLSHMMPADENELSVCTIRDNVLKNSEPRSSVGCRGTTHHPGITFLCQNTLHISCDMELPEARDAFYYNLHRTSVHCSSFTDIGSSWSDGVWRVCTAPPYSLEKNACLVYSFGIENEWSFDDSLSNNYGCEVHSFDPTMGVEGHKRDPRITFHNIGVAGRGDRYEEAKQKGWKMMSIKEIIHMLGHTDRIIDILKLDVEFTEWDAFEEAVKSNALKNVKQIATEFHVWRDDVKAYIKFNRIISALENAGFEKWYVGRKGIRFYYCARDPLTNDVKHYDFQTDMAYINTKFIT